MRRKRRANSRAVRQAEFEAKLRAWRSCATCFRCSDQPGGTPACDRCYLTEWGLTAHIDRGKTKPSVHRHGLVRVHAAGALIGSESGRAQLCRAVAQQAATVARHGGEGSSVTPTLHAVADFSLGLCDGSIWKPPVPVAGYATNRRLPPRRKSAAQLRFILFASQDLKDHGHESLYGHQANAVMLQVGTPAIAAQWPDVPYAEVTPDRLPRLPSTAQLEPAELTPILKLTRASIEQKLKRLLARERAPPNQADGESDDAEDGRHALGGHKRKRTGGEGATKSTPKRTNGGTVMLSEKATAALRADTERPVLVADLAKTGWVTGLAKVGVAHLQSPEGWTTCAALADAKPTEVAAWHAARPTKAPTVDFVILLTAALKVAMHAEVGEAEKDAEEDEEACESDRGGDEVDHEEITDDEIDAGEHESDSSGDDETDEEGCV